MEFSKTKFDAVDTFLYFAYGSNMLSQRPRKRTPSAVAIGVGYVPNRRLTFNKVSSDGSGKCDIALTASLTDRVYGVFFEISSTKKPILNRVEGVGKGYREEQIQVFALNGETYKAETYVATETESALRPYHWYKALVIAGAEEHKLPTEYVEWLRTFDSQSDWDEKRNVDNESLLFLG